MLLMHAEKRIFKEVEDDAFSENLGICILFVILFEYIRNAHIFFN